MSPLLFTLCMGYLSRLLGGAEAYIEFAFHPKCDKLKLTHLCFVDDLMVFCKGTLGSVRVVRNILDEFGAVSGLKMNVQKSRVHLGGVSATVRDQICRELGREEGVLPIRYLGFPLHSSGLQNVKFHPPVLSLK